MFLVMSDDDRRNITKHGCKNIYQTVFPNGGVGALTTEKSSYTCPGGVIERY
jgi:hypothetical protein